jgi:hypothetical protein
MVGVRPQCGTVGWCGPYDFQVTYHLDRIGGSCPAQASGRLGDGRPFYFRARHGRWDLSVGPAGATDDS